MTKKSTEKVQIHAKMLGEQRLLWNGGGWRVISRKVTVTGLDPSYSDVEVGEITVRHRTHPVWRRIGTGSMWTVNREGAVRYATPRQALEG